MGATQSSDKPPAAKPTEEKEEDTSGVKSRLVFFEKEAYVVVKLRKPNL